VTKTQNCAPAGSDQHPTETIDCAYTRRNPRIAGSDAEFAFGSLAGKTDAPIPASA
jgi:hypothetical protein